MNTNMTKEEYIKNTKALCDAIRSLRAEVAELRSEISAMKEQPKAEENHRPMAILSETDKVRIQWKLGTDPYGNTLCCASKVVFRDDTHVDVYYKPCPESYPTDKALEFMKKLISNYSDTEDVNKFLVGKVCDVCKAYKLNKTQVKLIMEGGKNDK